MRVILELSFNWIDWLPFGGGGGLHLKLDVQRQGVGRFSDVDEQGSWGSWKLDNFHGRHMCIIPRINFVLWSVGLENKTPCTLYPSSLHYRNVP